MLYQLINHRPAKPARRAEDEGLAMGRRHQRSLVAASDVRIFSQYYCAHRASILLVGD